MQSQQTPQTQTEAKLGGGFAGRTNQLADACYGFWCGAALALHQILGTDHLLDVHALGAFLARCQYKFGGIGKSTGRASRSNPVWKLQPLDPLINATHETARWAK
ncbi:terpenoid cyclases/protein prenyltransferase alpha-alpha toroid [Lactifluus volemus]|nr:terpenoid cyclases/protein prenyltransferase alpha-alpha toroid [Lactifluus volemus]